MAAGSRILCRTASSLKLHNKHGDSALDIARWRGYGEIVKLLQSR
jgi:hypothetical protein